jgi:hypothetical protein
VHLRRALLLFAIVLGTAALVASLSQPADERTEKKQTAEPGTPTATPRTPSSRPERPISFDAGRDESRRMRAGQAATLEVAVTEPGSVEIPDLGLSSPAAPLTPARFEVLPAEPGDYEIVFTAATATGMEPAGRLVVTSAG